MHDPIPNTNGRRPARAPSFQLPLASMKALLHLECRTAEWAGHLGSSLRGAALYQVESSQSRRDAPAYHRSSLVCFVLFIAIPLPLPPRFLPPSLALPPLPLFPHVIGKPCSRKAGGNKSGTKRYPREANDLLARGTGRMQVVHSLCAIKTVWTVGKHNLRSNILPKGTR